MVKVNVRAKMDKLAKAPRRKPDSKPMLEEVKVVRANSQVRPASKVVVVVKARGSGKPWVGADRVYDLRIDDHPQPVAELKRLVRLQKAYTHANRGDELMTEKKVAEALIEYAASAKIAPEIVELPFWEAVTLASVGKEAEARPIFTAVFAKEPIWAELLGRLPAAGLFPDDQALIARIQALAPKPKPKK